MSIKLIILCALLAIVTCTEVKEQISDQLQLQQEMKQLQNEQIREKIDLQHQQRQEQLQQLLDNRRVQEQFIRDQEQERLDRINEAKYQNRNIFHPYIHHHNPAVVHLRPVFVNIPSSSRTFNVHDDSNYNFGYTVTDITTGDMKSHQESRRGDQVQGQYTMLDSDGFRRTVIYRADDLNGFDANVHREPAYAALIFNPQWIIQPQNIAQISKIEDEQKTDHVTATENH